MSSHTPGPWEAHNHRIYAEDTNLHIADICRAPDGDWSPANARLIAAAPELLAALKIMTPLVRLKYGNLDSEVYLQTEKALAAIAKAEGRE
jgi:hypothetical protein